MKPKIVAGFVALIIIGTLAFVYVRLTPPQVTIPQTLSQKMQIPLYVPGWLPGDYHVDQSTVSIQEGHVFVYIATDSNRNRLFFSQQPIPKNFDFNRFYKTQVVDPVKLENVPFESYFAKAIYGSTLILSIVTDKSWIMMTTDAPIDKTTVQKIAQEMRLY